jgi:hypothetical protein
MERTIGGVGIGLTVADPNDVNVGFTAYGAVPRGNAKSRVQTRVRAIVIEGLNGRLNAGVIAGKT